MNTLDIIGLPTSILLLAVASLPKKTSNYFSTQTGHLVTKCLLAFKTAISSGLTAVAQEATSSSLSGIKNALDRPETSKTVDDIFEKVWNQISLNIKKQATNIMKQATEITNDPNKMSQIKKTIEDGSNLIVENALKGAVDPSKKFITNIAKHVFLTSVIGIAVTGGLAISMNYAYKFFKERIKKPQNVVQQFVSQETPTKNKTMAAPAA